MPTTLHEETPQIPLNNNGMLDLSELARLTLQDALNTLMDEQAQEMANELGVARNGYRERGLDTAVGTVTLKIPKLRQGTYYPDDIVERWSRTDTALAGAVCEMWASGISTRKVERATEKLGVKTMSRSKVSRLCSSLDQEVDELRSSDLADGPWPYLWLDATYVPCRENGRCRSVALVTAVACRADATRKVVAIESVDTESYLSWRVFLTSLRRRGMSGVKLVISDAHEGLIRAVSEVFVGSSWQRCIAHLERNVSDRARRKSVGAAVVAALKAAFAQSSPDLVKAGYDQACTLLEAEDPAGATLLEDAEASALAYLDFPWEHRMWIRTNNVQERMNEEIKRRTKVVGVFPSTESLVRLVGAVCCDQNDAWQGAKFIDRRSLEGLYDVEKSWEVLAEKNDNIQTDKEEIEKALRDVKEAFDSKLKAA